MFRPLFWLLDRTPGWLRPAVVGAVLISALTAGRVLLVLPDFRVRPQAVRDALWLAAAAPMLGAVAGLAYAVASRWVTRVPGVGPYLAGVATVGAYLGAMAILIVASGEDLDMALWIAFGICTVIFGLVVGHQFFRDEPTSRAP